MKITFIPAFGAGTKGVAPTTEEAPGRITQREQVPVSGIAEGETSDEIKLADTDPMMPVVSAKTANAAKRPMIYRSVSRPAMAVLTALDDGSASEGEQWRIRSDRFVIGRTVGDCVISHDLDISGKHVEIAREAHGMGFHWSLKDLNSTNGLFVQVRRVILRHGQELLLGGRRYEFQKNSLFELAAEEATNDRTRRSFGQWQENAHLLKPRLVQRTPHGDGLVYPLKGETSWIGSDPHCELHVHGDPFLSGQHARLSRDQSGRWVLTDCKSLNGILVRVHRVTLEGERRFQIGGQRFLFRVL